MAKSAASNQCMLEMETKIVNCDLDYLKKILTTINQEKARVLKNIDDGVSKQELVFWQDYQKSLVAATDVLHKIWDHFHSA